MSLSLLHAALAYGVPSNHVQPALVANDDVLTTTSHDKQVMAASRHLHLLPQPIPVARSVLTTHPDQAADMFIALFGEGQGGAKLVPQNISSSSACADVRTVQTSFGTFSFVNDFRKPNPTTMTMSNIIGNVQGRFAEVDARRMRYTQWEDNHDGFGIRGATGKMNLSRAFGIGGGQWYATHEPRELPPWSDPKLMARFGHDGKFLGLLRFFIPGSLWTIELFNDKMANFKQKFTDPARDARVLASKRQADADTCRTNSVDVTLILNGTYDGSVPWFKATTSTSDPAAAKRFAIRYLGAQSVDSVYPSRRKGCHYAEWVAFDGRPTNQTSLNRMPTNTTSPFMLHFVDSPIADFPGGSPNVAELSAAVNAGRRFDGGIFDKFAYDSFTLWVADLAPYIHRFDADSVPYLVRGWPATNTGGILFAIPGATVVYELRSDKGIPPEALVKYDACSSQ